MPYMFYVYMREYSMHTLLSSSWHRHKTIESRYVRKERSFSSAVDHKIAEGHKIIYRFPLCAFCRHTHEEERRKGTSFELILKFVKFNIKKCTRRVFSEKSELSLSSITTYSIPTFSFINFLSWKSQISIESLYDVKWRQSNTQEILIFWQFICLQNIKYVHKIKVYKKCVCLYLSNKLNKQRVNIEGITSFHAVTKDDTD